MTVAASILRELRDAASSEKEAVLRRFFKTGPGEYGEGDRFLGVMVPRIRAIARSHLKFARAADVRTLLASPLHEARECGKRDPRRLRLFLSGHAPSMPRTALRYAIERFPAGERRKWLSIPRRPRR